MEERLGHVSVCLDDPGRFHIRGKTGPNTDFIKKSGRGVGMGQGNKVDGHMFWGVLSGAHIPTH
jgi:hypothetical protein